MYSITIIKGGEFPTLNDKYDDLPAARLTPITSITIAYTRIAKQGYLFIYLSIHLFRVLRRFPPLVWVISRRGKWGEGPEPLVERFLFTNSI